jgi:hypothetical protein
MRLANLLPGFLRSLVSSRSAGMETNSAAEVSFLRIRDYWYTQTDEMAARQMAWFQDVLNAIPIELQAFILHDDDGRFLTGEWQSPLHDPENTQPLSNVSLLEKPAKKLQTIVANAKKRIENETKVAIKEGSWRQQRSFMELRPDLRQRRFKLGNHEFGYVGLGYLLDRARQRLFFLLGAEEILDALAESNEEAIASKLDQAWFYHMSGSLTGQLFVENDSVHLNPPILFSFVVGVQASRIRRCEICENYFWAGRIDKKTCSPQCSATRRKRKQRESDSRKRQKPTKNELLARRRE